MSFMYYEKDGRGISDSELREKLISSLPDTHLQKVLILPPDFTRVHSNAGRITNIYYHYLTEKGCRVDIMPAVGTHERVTREEAEIMFGDIPYEKLLVHNWRTDVVKLGEVPGSYLKEISEGMWTEGVSVEVNSLVMDSGYDLILSVGQVVPHVVVGMANHAKNLFVGVGGRDMISKSHMLGAVYGMDRILGRDHTPVRKLFDYAYEHFLYDRPIQFVLTVCTAEKEKIHQHGLFIGHGRDILDSAVVLAQKHNVTYMQKRIRKCVAYLDPMEFKSTWVGDKALYRTCMAMEKGGELVILAPGVRTFGEDPGVDRMLRMYGYRGHDEIMRHYYDPEDPTLRENQAVAAHLLQGSAHYGKFTVTYAVSKSFMQDVEQIGYQAADYAEISKRYDPEKLTYGWHTMPDGEEIFYIPAPALGLWIAEDSASS